MWYNADKFGDTSVNEVTSVKKTCRKGDIEMDEEVLEELKRRGIQTLDELNEALKEKKIDIRIMGERDDDLRD